MQSWINGQQAELISIQDRGFQYGDGCFETVRLCSNFPVLLPAHLERLRNSCQLLNIAVDFDLLQWEIKQLLQVDMSTDHVLKIMITRGIGGRGYKPDSNSGNSRILQLFDYNADSEKKKDGGVNVFLCKHRLSSSNTLAGIKHLNRLDQVLASQEIPAHYDEGICMDQEGHIVEGCKSNLILTVDGQLCTPDLSCCGVDGIMLNYLISNFAKQRIDIKRRKVSLENLAEAEEVFLCNSVYGVWPVIMMQANATALSWKPGAHTYSAIQFKNEIFGIHNKH